MEKRDIREREKGRHRKEYYPKRHAESLLSAKGDAPNRQQILREV